MSTSEPPSPLSTRPSLQNQNTSLRSQETALLDQTTSNPQAPPTRNNTQQTTTASPQVASPPTSAVNGGSSSPAANPDQGRRRSSGRPKNIFRRLHSAFTPSKHDLKEYDAVPSDTIRPYLHRQQRHRLQRKSWAEWFITLLLCVAYFLILKLYQHDKAIDKRHRRIFNSLVTGTVLLLGVNLNNSLRSYAKMIRWRFLASGYRPLKEFDLIMGCDSVMNVLALLRHGRHKNKAFPFNSMVQLYALIWLIVQLGIVVCVGIIGLTYNLDVSNSRVNTQTGNTSSIDLLSLSTGNYLTDLGGLQQWGVRGYALNPAPFVTLDKQYAQYGSYLTDGQGNSRRFFVDYNPDHYYINVISSRYIDSSVVCTQYRVTEGQFGNLTYITYESNGTPINETLFGSPGPSGLYVSANTNSTCGPRCTNVVLMQAESPPDDRFKNIYIDQALRFECNNTVSNVQDWYGDVDVIYRIPEFLSRMLAGMLGWSTTPPNGTIEYQIYQEASQIGWGTTPTVTAVQDYVSQWTIAGVAAMDARDGSSIGSGLQRMFVNNGLQPIQAQVLSVKWWAAGTILAAIPFVHFWTLILVIFFANKVVIKDDNPIAVAKVYHTLLNKIGDHHGCMFTGDQVIENLELEHRVSRVIYGVIDGDNGIKHVDVFEEGSEVRPMRAFPEGDYDGDGYSKDERDEKGCRKRRMTHGKFDASEYF